MFFIEMGSLFGVFILFYLIKKGFFEVWPYLQGGLYSEVVFNTGLTVCVVETTPMYY